MFLLREVAHEVSMDVVSLIGPSLVGRCRAGQRRIRRFTALQDFEKRINDYVNLEKNLAKGLSIE